MKNIRVFAILVLEKIYLRGDNMRTVNEMYEAIRDWEMEAGEDFVDYFDSSINEANLLFWALGKGYITPVQFQAWEANRSYASNSEIVFGQEEWSIVKHVDGTIEDYDLAYLRLAEFLASSITYQARVEEFLTNIRQVTFENAMKAYKLREKVLFEFDGERVYLGHDTPLTAEIIKESKWFIDDNNE